MGKRVAVKKVRAPETVVCAGCGRRASLDQAISEDWILAWHTCSDFVVSCALVCTDANDDDPENEDCHYIDAGVKLSSFMGDNPDKLLQSIYDNANDCGDGECPWYPEDWAQLTAVVNACSPLAGRAAVKIGSRDAKRVFPARVVFYGG